MQAAFTPAPAPAPSGIRGFRLDPTPAGSAAPDHARAAPHADQAAPIGADRPVGRRRAIKPPASDLAELKAAVGGLPMFPAGCGRDRPDHRPADDPGGRPASRLDPDAHPSTPSKSTTLGAPAHGDEQLLRG